jgi:hypothetical protein
MKAVIIATLILALPASITLSAPAEAKRFRFSGSASKPGGQTAKPAQTPEARPMAGRGGATILVVPGIGVGAAQAATKLEETEARKQLDAANRQAEEEARKETARKAEGAYRASLPPGHEIPRLGMLSAHEGRQALPGFATLN